MNREPNEGYEKAIRTFAVFAPFAVRFIADTPV